MVARFIHLHALLTLLTRIALLHLPGFTRSLHLQARSLTLLSFFEGQLKFMNICIYTETHSAMNAFFVHTRDTPLESLSVCPDLEFIRIMKKIG